MKVSLDTTNPKDIEDAKKFSGIFADISDEMLDKKIYKFQASRGSKVQLEIEVKIQELNKEDMEDILHEVASCSHNFYLDLGKKIAAEMGRQLQEA